MIVEGTAGNTGIGLALVGNARGYRTVIVIPDTQSQEKKDMLRLCGAELREVPAVPYANPNNYVQVSGRLAEELARTRAERRDLGQPVRQRRQPPARTIETTGPGDLGADRRQGRRLHLRGRHRRHAGAASRMHCKERNPRIAHRLADPMGAALYSYYTNGELKAEGTSITEGIGQGRITANLEGAPGRRRRSRSPTSEALPIVFDLLEQEGLCLGGSTGINVAGAIRLARELGPGHTIVTVLCDCGTRYPSKLFNPEFLRDQEPAGAGMAGIRARSTRPTPLV